MMESIERLIQQGEQSLRAGDFEGATKVLRQACALFPTDPRVHFHLGVVLIEQEKFEEAVRAFEQSVGLNPTFAAAWHNLGYCQYRTGHIENSIESLQRAIAVQPDKWDSFFLLGICYFLLVKLEQAADPLEKALEYGGDAAPRAKIYEMLATAYDVLGQTEKANYYATLLEQSRKDEEKPETQREELSTVEHFLYFPTEEKAFQAIDAIRAQGYEAELLSEPEEPDEDYCVFVKTVVSDSEFMQVVEQLEQVASCYGGEYDGWGHDV
ncbi:MAG: tetratricopeptide repeat protein [Fimbriimonadales bacterium]|nr:tetratricopeptide repeat protein [Fimbriimonadales bacterium]